MKGPLARLIDREVVRQVAAMEQRLRAEQDQQRRELTVIKQTLHDHAELFVDHDWRKPATDGATLPLFTPSLHKGE